MSQTLRIALSDEVYAALQQHAEATGTSPSDLAATTLALQYSARLAEPGVSRRLEVTH